jgi:plastocyanin
VKPATLFLFHFPFLVLACLAALPGHSATVEVAVTDARGAAIEDAIVWLMPRAGAAPARRRESAVEQRDKAFIPLVTVVQAGTPVHFPNRDPIRHHVYSFSPAKTFEIKLYAGTPVAPIVFDKPGEVILGCNIHDHMLAYVYVVDTPWFAKTGRDGKGRIEGAPAGEYELHLWHFAQASPHPPQAVRLKGDEVQASAFSVPLRPPVPRPAPK